MEPAFIHFHLERVAAAFGCVERSVSEDVELVLLAADFLESGKQIVGVENGKAARAFGQGRKNLLIGRY